MRDIDQILVDYVLGHSHPDDSVWFEQRLDADPALRQRLKEFQDLVVHSAPKASPPPALKSRIMESIGDETRFLGFAERLANLVDVSLEHAREILQDASRFPSGSWEPSLIPGMQALHFAGGGALRYEECGVVHMEPGTTFPAHSHSGNEGTMILQGEHTDSDGHVYLPGDIFYKSQGDEHSYQATGDVPLMFVVFHNGIEIQ